MTTGRLEAFSDGLVAIVITIMVLEARLPEDRGFDALAPLVPVFLSYLLSFICIGICWANHHHVFQGTGRVNGRIPWAILHLLVWLSLIACVTGWISARHAAAGPVASCGFVVLMAAIAYNLVEQLIVRDQGCGSRLTRAVGRESKGWRSAALHIAAIGLAFILPWVSGILHAVMALLRIVPDRRIERILSE